MGAAALRSETISIKDTLYSWGRGERMNWATNGYPKRAAFAQFMLNSGDSVEKSSQIPRLPDDIHGMVDAVISPMKLRKPSHYKIICMTYIAKLPEHEIASRMHVSRSTIHTMLEAADAWVESGLYAYTVCNNIQAVCIDSG